jgi:hypothetical protein
MVFQAKQVFCKDELSPIAKTIFELYNHSDNNIRLGAMLLCSELKYYSDIENYLRVLLSDRDERWIRCIKSFALSRYTYKIEDIKQFIEFFPDDKENFEKLLDFESNVIRLPYSPTISHLVDFAKYRHKNELQDIALTKINKIRKISDGWVGEFIHDRLEME